MLASMVFLCLSIHTAADHTSFSVSQAPKEAIVSTGGNITFYCIFPISQEHSWVQVLWWKQGENEYLRRSAEGRRRFGLKSKASGYFQLLSVNIQDSGVYHCAVIRQGVLRGNGTGSHLIVHVAPTPLKIVSRTPQRNTSAFLTLVCETASFYPENFTLTWYKNGIETAFGIHTNKVQNTEGLYEVSSSLVETQSVPSDTNYSCLVSHVSLRTPAVVIHTVSKSNQDSVHNSFSFWTAVCAVAGLAFLVLMIVIGMRCRLQNNESKEECDTGPNRSEELGATAEVMHYAAINLSRTSKTPRHKREEIQRRGTGNDLTYATLAFTGSEKNGEMQ
ncbi:CD276 antigen homolog [Heterodontus francisci]|uniref:CD276 antigen homolog n=1 Tax=Heterodontus francisci TaxID=7792 RepID=UPI00355BC5DF